MEPFKLIHIKRKAKLKGKEEQKILDDKYIDQLKESHNLELKNLEEKFLKELNEKISYYQNEVSRLQSEHKKDILEIRKQEKDYYEPLLKEKNNEITNLQMDKIENKKYYDDILNYGLMLEDNSNQTMDIFQRAKMKITQFLNYITNAEKAYSEAIQLIETGKGKIEFTQTQIEKQRPKLLKGMKE
jgi:hypothetical protein